MAESFARSAANLHKQYVWGLRYIDAPLLRDRETDGGSAGLDERLYYTQDGNFNVTALVNTAGDVVERYSYDAYGQVTVRNGAENVDPETGLYHVRHRYLHPTLGRWTTRDPAGYVDGMGLYEYCSSSPLSSVDPSGGRSSDWARHFKETYHYAASLAESPVGAAPLPPSRQARRTIEPLTLIATGT